MIMQGGIIINSIFISSSFMDFQSERDIIRSIVLPEINEYLRQNYAQETNIIDLRWGIDTSSDTDEYTSMGKILETCLVEIQNCQPFMVVLLGNRYGTKASKQQVQEHLTACDEVDIPEDGIGVTELEIRYAMHLASKHQMNIRFYFRDMDYKSVPTHLMPLFFDQIDATDKKARLELLKNEIRAQYEDHCNSYNAFWSEDKNCVDGLTDFARMMIDDLKECIATELGAPSQQKRSVDRAFMKSNQKYFVGRQHEMKRLTRFLESDISNTCLVRGAPGSGKSALLANMPQNMDTERYSFLTVFCGQDQLSDTALDVIAKITEGINELIAGESTIHSQGSLTAVQLREEMENAIGKYLSKSDKTLVILIDGIDQLMEDVLSKKMFYLPQDTSRVKTILSAPDEYIVDYSIPSLIHLEEFQLEDPTEEEVNEIVHNIWHRHGKYSVSAEAEASLACKTLSKNYLYLHLIVTRLTFMGKEVFGSEMNSAQFINDTIVRTINEFPDTLEDAAAEFIRVLGQTINPALANEVFEYLRISHNGLRELDLQALCGEQWNALDFSLIKKLLGDFLFERNDHRIDFTHKVFRRIGKIGETQAKKLCQRYCDYALSLPADDSQSVAYSVHSTLCTGAYSSLYHKISAWKDSADMLQLAAEELAVILSENHIGDIKGLVEYFPIMPFDGEVVRFFTDYLAPLLQSDRYSIALFEGISDKIPFLFLDDYQQAAACNFEYVRYLREKEYSSNIDPVLSRLHSYLATVMSRNPSVINCGKYIDVVSRYSDNILFPQNKLDNCIALLTDDDSDDAAFLRAKAEIIQAGLKYPKALFRLDEAAEKHIDRAIALIDEIASKAANQQTHFSRKKYAMMIAETYKMMGDIYLRVDNASGRANIAAEQTFYGNAEFFYKTSIQAFNIYISDLDQLEIECLIEAAVGLATVCVHWNVDEESTANLQKDILALMEQLENRIYIVLQSQSLSVLYANLCGMMADMFGSSYDDPPFENIYSLEDGFSKVNSMEQLDYWSRKQISMHKNIVRANPTPDFVHKLCQAIISRLKIKKWYGYRSKRTIELQFGNVYGINYESLQRRFRNERDFEKDVDIVQRRIPNPAEFDVEEFVNQLKNYRQSISDDEQLHLQNMIRVVFELFDALKMLPPEDSDYAYSLYLHFGLKLMRLRKMYGVDIDTGKFRHMQIQMLRGVQFALCDPYSLSWYVVCRYPDLKEWGFDDLNLADQLLTISSKVDTSHSQHPAYSHRNSDTIYELDTII